MAHTIIGDAKANARAWLGELQGLENLSKQDIAERIGCTPVTLSKMLNDPFSVSAEWWLMLYEHLRRARLRHNHYE